MTRKRKRLLILGCGMAALAAAAAMVLSAFSNNLVFFYGPSELVAEGVHSGQLVRIGGLVEQHSVVHESGGRFVRFRVTDGKTDIAVVYDGVLPDLFREGQGVVAEGRLNNAGIFVASDVLAKHDEKYMPPEVAAALKKAGRWQEGGKPPL
ncbi:MAG: cytochrome c maturation protein CcmE [Stellaceae bacterium]